MAIETDTLLFSPVSPNDFLALIDGADSFLETFGCAAADGLRDFIVSDDVPPEFIASLKEGGEPDPWRWGFFVILKTTGIVIGNAGFKGPPGTDGMVEIAYGIVPSFENNGYATIAARQLVEFALSDPRVKLVIAHTLPMTNASTRVLEKNGFRCVGTIDDPDDGTVWRWQHTGTVG